MSADDSDLAARLMRAWEHEQSRDDSREQEEKGELKVRKERRLVLFERLIAFGKQLPFLEVRVDGSGDGLTFGSGKRALVFAATADELEVVVEFTGRGDNDIHVLYTETELADRWVWKRTRLGRETRVAFFEQGLEILLVHALRLPDPDEARGPSPSSSQPDETSGEKKDDRWL